MRGFREGRSDWPAIHHHLGTHFRSFSIYRGRPPRRAPPVSLRPRACFPLETICLGIKVFTLADITVCACYLFHLIVTTLPAPPGVQKFFLNRLRRCIMRLPKSSLRHVALLLFSILTLPLGRAAAQTTNIPARITQAVDEKNLVVLKGNVHPLARAEYDQGAVADGRPLNRMLLLLQRSPDQESVLRHLLDDQQSKSSPNYHAWLTPEQFGQQFGPADADIQAITAWLTSQGFNGINVGPGRTVIEFSGNVAQVRSAFRTEIHRYVVNGEEHTANTNDLQIPAALAPVVAGVVSLHNFSRKSHARVLGEFRRALGKTGLEPLFTFPIPFFNGGTFYGLGPGDFATIYNSKPLIAAANDGTGQTIAIVGETNINVQDVQQFRKMFGLPPNFDATNVILNGEDPGITSLGEEGEADLDVQWSGAVAPGATVKFVVSASTPASAGVDLSALYIVEHNLAAVMSESYGDCEQNLGSAGNAFYNSLWEQAAAQGITVVISSGDGGSAGCDNFNTQQVATRGLAVSGLASTPFNVSVGGTDFDQVNNWAAYWNPTNDPTGTSAKSYIPEIPWNQNCAQIGLTGCGVNAPIGSVNIVAGSGGASSVYGKPTWQIGVTGVPNDSHRDQPDISLFASPGFDGTGYVYCQSDQTISGARSCDLNASSGVLDFGIVGGTSASAPAFAGIMALVNQKQATTASPAPRQGNANYVLYALAKKAGASCTSSATEAASCVFNDITKGNSFLPTGAPGVGTNSVPCQGGSLNCSVGNAGSNGVLVDPSHTSTEAWTATAGYDMTTGLGTVNVNNLATNWGSVSTIPTTTTLVLSPTTGVNHGINENVTVGITVKPNTGTGVPGGDVSLIATPIPPDGTTRGLDQFTLANGAISGVKTQSLPGGTYNVSAHYAGDGTNAPSDSASVQVTVAKESSQTFIVVPTFDSQGNLLNGNATSVTYGSRYLIRMYVTDKNGVASTTGPPTPTCYQENLLTCPSGTVTLTDNGALADVGGGGPGIYNLNNFGYTRDLTPNLLGGVHSLVPTYSGDQSYQAGTSAADTVTVMPAPITLYFPAPPNPLVGSPFFVQPWGNSNVSQGVSPTGTISIYDGTSLIAGPITVSSFPNNGFTGFAVSLYLTLNSGGDHSLTFQYSGDANYGATTSAPTIVHPLYSTTMTLTQSATTINLGESVALTASASTLGKSPAMTGPFYFSPSYTSIVNPVTPVLSTDSSGNQILTATVTTAPKGSESIQVLYPGDSNFASSVSNNILVNVNIPDFTLGPASGLSVVPVAGQPGSGQITITPVSQTPSTVALSFSPLAISGYTITLSPQQVSLNGSAATATISLTPIVSGAANALRYQARHATFLSMDRGDWWFLSLATGLCLPFLLRLRGGRRKFRAALAVGTACLVCFALGCGSSGVTGGEGGGGGTPLPTSITLTTSNAKVAQNTQFLITATVTSSKPLTGTINFYNFGTPIVSGIPPTNGQAQTGSGYINNLGLYQITATYSGDANNLASTSAPLTQVLTGTMPVTIQASTGGDVHYLQATLGLQ